MPSGGGGDGEGVRKSMVCPSLPGDCSDLIPCMCLHSLHSGTVKAQLSPSKHKYIYFISICWVVEGSTEPM